MDKLRERGNFRTDPGARIKIEAKSIIYNPRPDGPEFGTVLRRDTGQQVGGGVVS